jgi:hypothetical protein
VVRHATRCELTKEDHHVHRVAVYAEPRFPRAIVILPNILEAQRLVAALEPPESLAMFNVATRSATFGRSLFATGVIAFCVSGVLNVMLHNPMWLLLAVAGAVATKLPTQAGIGRDGVVISCLGVQSFIPFAAVTRVERDYGVAFHMNDGRVTRIQMKPEQIDAFIEAVEKARRHANDTLTTERLLTRGAQNVTAWRDELQRLAQPGYRQQALERERLWEVYENPNAEESARVGAAILLRSNADDGDRARLVRIAAQVASPALREQLEDDDVQVATMQR